MVAPADLPSPAEPPAPAGLPSDFFDHGVQPATEHPEEEAAGDTLFHQEVEDTEDASVGPELSQRELFERLEQEDALLSQSESPFPVKKADTEELMTHGELPRFFFDEGTVAEDAQLK